MPDEYQIRKGGVPVVGSSIVNCGYTQEQLKSLFSAGYRLYRNGKLVKKEELGWLKNSGRR